MEVYQIRYFLAVADLLNFTRAAEQCNVAQPSLTRGVRLLEDELGGELFRREHRATHLTPFGQRMLPLLKQSYDSMTAAKDLARSYSRRGSEPLSIALSTSVDVSLLAPPLAELFRIFPDVEVKIIREPSRELVSVLRAGGVDLACAGPLAEVWERLDMWRLFAERFTCVARHDHPLAHRTSVSLADIARERVLGDLHGHDFIPGEACAGAKPRLGAVASAPDVLRLVEAGLGIALLPNTWPIGHALRRIPVRDLDASREVRLYAVAGRRRSPAAALLVKLLRARNWDSPEPASANVTRLKPMSAVCADFRHREEAEPATHGMD
jgi:DNA-binding transcriptional LysR family regulator